MKKKYILKIIGLVSAFCLSSTFFVSCDSDSSNSSGNNLELPADINELQNGGVFEVIFSGGIIDVFTITDLEARTVTLSDSIENLTFDFDGKTLTIIDNRVTPAQALEEVNQLTGNGGSAEDELNALLANDSKANLGGLILAINDVTQNNRFFVDLDRDDRVFIFRQIAFQANTETFSGFLVSGDSHPFTLGETTQVTNDKDISITYTAP